LSRKGAKRDAGGRKLRSTGTKVVTRVGQRPKPHVDLEQQLEKYRRKLTEALEQQTATSEVLRVISSSPAEVQPVFDTIAVNALRLCGATFSLVIRFDGDVMELASFHKLGDPTGFRHAFPRRPGRGGANDRAILTRAIAHIPDIWEDPDYVYRGLAQATGYRSILSVPMLRKGEPIGVVTVAGASPGAFSDRQVDLLRTFADQAAIAIENVRLFEEEATARAAAEAARDAAERARTETAAARDDVERTREVLQTVLDNMSDGIVLFDKDVRLRFANRKLMEFYQYTPEVAHQGASIYDLLRFQVERGDFGRVDDVERVVQKRAALALKPGAIATSAGGAQQAADISNPISSHWMMAVCSQSTATSPP